VPRVSSPLAVAALAAILGGAPASARAAAPADGEVTARLAFVVRALEREQPGAQAWSSGWAATYGGLFVAQAALAANAVSNAGRAAAIAGSLKSGVGLAARLVLPFTARDAATRLRLVAADTPAARRAKLALAERLLAESAGNERFGRSWVPLAVGLALNLSSTFMLWGGFHSPGSGWFGLGAGTAVSQLQFWTQPTGALTAWDAYTRGAWRAPAAPPAAEWSVRPLANGMALGWAF
jgi:hypothetical protein